MTGVALLALVALLAACGDNNPQASSTPFFDPNGIQKAIMTESNRTVTPATTVGRPPEEQVIRVGSRYTPTPRPTLIQEINSVQEKDDGLTLNTSKKSNY